MKLRNVSEQSSPHRRMAHGAVAGSDWDNDKAECNDNPRREMRTKAAHLVDEGDELLIHGGGGYTVVQVVRCRVAALSPDCGVEVSIESSRPSESLRPFELHLKDPEALSPKSNAHDTAIPWARRLASSSSSSGSGTHCYM